MTTKDSIRSHGGRDFLPIRTVQIKTQSGVHVWSPREAKITKKKKTGGTGGKIIIRTNCGKYTNKTISKIKMNSLIWNI